MKYTNTTINDVISKLESWNVENAYRVTNIDPDTRFNPTIRPGSNQNVVNNPNYINITYKWLIGTTTQFKNETGHFTCWVPSGVGIDDADNGYKRFSYKGDKVLCHRFVWYYYNPGKPIASDYDISHLCGNKQCCRLSHLHCELKQNNIARIGCMAYIVSIHDHNDVFNICNHNPTCKTARYVRDSNVVILEPEK